jgi:hypothetical protein
MKRLLLLLVPLMLMVACSSEPDEESLYHRYADRNGLTVAEIDGFSLNDSVMVDVVILQAESDEEWQNLCEEFDIHGEEGTLSWLGETGNPAQRTEWDGGTVMRVIASHSRRTIGFYRIENEVQYDALIDYQLNKLKLSAKPTAYRENDN